MCVLQRQEGVGRDGALALALGARQQVVDGQLSGGEWDGGNLGRGGERLQLVEILMLHQLVQQHLLLLLGGESGKAANGGVSRGKVKVQNVKSEREARVKVICDHHENNSSVACVCFTRFPVWVVPVKAARTEAAGADAAAGGVVAAQTADRDVQH